MENAGLIANKKVFALIGGIASGKTAVSDILRELGAYIIDADIISRAVTAPGSFGEAELIKHFGDCIQDGKISRRLIKEKVFNNTEALKTLNDITHPLIINEIHRQIENAQGVIVVVMPVPVELRRYHTVLSVYAPVDVRISRLIKRDNITEELAKKIIDAQMSDEKAASVADFTFINDGDKQKLRRSVIAWWKFYIEG